MSHDESCQSRVDAVLGKWSRSEKDEALEWLLLEKMELDSTEQIPIEGPRSQSLIGWFLPLAPMVEQAESKLAFGLNH